MTAAVAASAARSANRRSANPARIAPPMAKTARAARRRPASANSSRDPGKHLFGQQHEGSVAKRRAQQVVEADLVAQPQDLVADLVGAAVQDHLVQIALDRVDAGGCK